MWILYRGRIDKKARQKMMTVKELAEIINEDCRGFRYFYAVGLIKETLKLWQKTDNFRMLNKTARVFANHYLEENLQESQKS